jgi:hypothetical protein
VRQDDPQTACSVIHGTVTFLDSFLNTATCVGLTEERFPFVVVPLTPLMRSTAAVRDLTWTGTRSTTL